MAFISIPTSKDIYLEINGQKVAVVESYKTKSVREIQQIEEIGSAVPVATIGVKTLHSVTLKRVYFVADTNKKLDFFVLANFDLVVVKPHSRVHFVGCEWQSISECTDINSPCIEEMVLTASERIEVNS